MKFIKYGLVFIIPALFVLGVKLKGWAVLSPFLFAFVFIPGIELIFKPNHRNLDRLEAEVLREDRSYDFLLYLVVPVLYFIIGLYLYSLANTDYTLLEVAGLTISLSVILGGLGINVAHELGHRSSKMEQIMAKILLLPSAYMHFFIEHNRGHHKNVSTEEDPASSRKNESLYAFWVRSVYRSYLSAWNIENKRLERLKINKISLKNEMLLYTIIQMLFWLIILFIFGWKITICYTIAAVGGFLLLETVNYIEHYGLQRHRVNEFRYEKVQPIHSWNSNHVVGRLVLFELSRHSDHHYDPTKKYQVLSNHEHSPQMPTGYPGMMLLSLLPPLWFAVMNPKLPDSKEGQKILNLSAT
jgi:alkane 1-monooxygenase